MPLALWGAGTCFTLGVLILFLGLAIYRGDPLQRLNRAAALMLGFGGLASLEVGLQLSALGAKDALPPEALEFARYMRVVWQFFFPSLVLFVLLFPRPVTWYRRVPFLGFLVYFPYLLHFLLVAVEGISRGSFFLPQHPGRNLSGTALHALDFLLKLMFDAHVILFSLVDLGYVMATVLMLLVRRREVGSTRLRDQLDVITLGVGLSLALYCAADPLPNIFGWRELQASGLRLALLGCAMGLATGAIAYAIVRHKFLDTGFDLRRAILYLLPALAVVIAYVFVAEFARDAFIRWSLFDARLVEPLLVLVTVLLVPPVAERFESVVEGYLQRDRREGRTVLQRLSVDIVTIFDMEVLAGRIAGSLGESLFVERCAFLRREGEFFHPLACYDIEQKLVSGELLTQDRLLWDCAARLVPDAMGGGVSRLSELADHTRPGWPSPMVAESFRISASALGLDLFVPVRHGDEVLGAIALGRKRTRGKFTAEDLALLATLANQTGAAIRNTVLVAENVQQRAMEEELNLARQIQQGYLPRSFPVLKKLEVHGTNRPSRHVGGDYFDVLHTPDSLLLVIADVSGKGVPAALIMSMMQASLRTQDTRERSLPDVLGAINSLMLRSGQPGRFATAFVARVELDTLDVRYTNAGHNPPMLLRADGRCEWLGTGGLLLGSFEDPRLEEGSFQLEAGDCLLLYTDGVTEARSPAGEFFGEEGLEKLLRERPQDCTAQHLTQTVAEAVHAFAESDDLEDDMTLLALRVPQSVRLHRGGQLARDQVGVVGAAGE